MSRKSYKELWDTMQVLPSKQSSVKWYLDKCIANKLEYKDASEYVAEKIYRKIPWEIIALIHSLEAGNDMSRQILNGEPWNRRTSLVPAGLGPWKSFNGACVTAFKHSRWENVDFDDVDSLLGTLEMFNGAGYKNRGKNSPYLWSFSNHGVGTGKYIADGKYSATAVSKQCGCAVLLKELGHKFKHEPGYVSEPVEEKDFPAAWRELKVKHSDEFKNLQSEKSKLVERISADIKSTEDRQLKEEEELFEKYFQ